MGHTKASAKKLKEQYGEDFYSVIGKKGKHESYLKKLPPEERSLIMTELVKKRWEKQKHAKG